VNSSHSIKNITLNAIAAAALALGIVAAVNAASPAQAESAPASAPTYSIVIDRRPASAVDLTPTSLTTAPEVADGAKGGNVEFEWKVEEGES
jgi:hypothetical protein